MPRTKYSTDDYSPGPMSPVSPGPQSPGRPLHSPCPRSPLSPYTPTSLSPKPEHSPLKPSSPVPYGSPASQSRSPTQTPKETTNRWPQSTPKTLSPTIQNSHWAGTNSANQSSVVRAVSPSTQSSAFPHRAGATTANTPRYTDPSQVRSHCMSSPLVLLLVLFISSQFIMSDARFSISSRVQYQTRLLHLIHTLTPCHTRKWKTTLARLWRNTNRKYPDLLFTLLQQRPSVAAMVNVWLRPLVFFLFQIQSCLQLQTTELRWVGAQRRRHRTSDGEMWRRLVCR